MKSSELEGKSIFAVYLRGLLEFSGRVKVHAIQTRQQRKEREEEKDNDVKRTGM